MKHVSSAGMLAPALLSTLFAIIAFTSICGVSSAQTAWEENTSANTPPIYQNLAYDSRRGVCVYYYGIESPETWEYDGVDWTQVVTAHNPGPRFDVTTTYDSSRRVVVLHGGTNAGTNLNDTWEYDGDDWTQVLTNGAPPIRWYPELVFDPVGKRCLLIGGRLVGVPHETQTWEFDGATSTWTRISTPVAPTSALWSWIAYDSWNHRTLLYGGSTPGLTALNELWQFDNATDTWSQLPSVAGPGYREKGMGAFDELRGKFVVHGGKKLNSGTAYQDTWEYDVTTNLWAEFFDSPSPAVNPTFGMAYDSRRARIVLASVVGNGSLVRETWEFGGGVYSAGFCAGDGSPAMSCPCGNDAPFGAGSGCVNSQGHGAVISLSGSTNLAADDAVLHLDQARPGSPSLLLQGSDRVVFPFMDGILCMGNPTLRLEALILDGSGAGFTANSIATTGGVRAGTVKHYQFWYRDPQISPCGTGSNFSNAISLYWQ